MDPQENTETTLPPKQQVVERVKAATNVLVTVSSNPSVDELASAIGMTLMLNKLGKHATAVFSGKVPSTLEFLKPSETIEVNTDSLRDFIVSLDKAKADKLRYKVEENVVKIFITPYRTSLSEKDLEFTQGDFNIDVVLALGVGTREDLDQAITAHGRILHDATVITISAGQKESTLGAINWQEPGASSLSEMIVSVSEAFQSNLLDGQMATAFLTGIVAETERFRNPKTTPKVMTMSAQLMAAGANQQLIASELEKELVAEAAPAAEAPKPASKDGSLEVKHDEPAPQSILPPVPMIDTAPEQKPEPEIDQTEIHIDNNGNLKKQWEVDKAAAPAAPEAPAEEAGNKLRHKVVTPLNQEPKEEPKTDLKSFDFAGGAGTGAPQPTGAPLSTAPPFSSNMPGQPPEENINPLVPPSVSPLMPGQQPPTTEENISGLALPPIGGDTLLDIEKSVHSPHIDTPAISDHEHSARNAVMDAINTVPYDQSRPEPVHALNAQPMFDVTAPPAVLAEPTSTQAVFPLAQPSDMFASHDLGTPAFPVPDQPAPQVPGGMPLHDLGETLPESKPEEDDAPPVPPPMMSVA